MLANQTKLPPVKKIVLQNKIQPLLKKNPIKYVTKSSGLKNESSTNMTTKSFANTARESNTNEIEKENNGSLRMGTNIDIDEEKIPQISKKPIINKPTTMLPKSNILSSQKNLKYMMDNGVKRELYKGESSKPSFQNNNYISNKINLFNKGNVNNKDTGENINKNTNEIITNKNTNVDNYNKNVAERYKLNFMKKNNVIDTIKPKSFINNTIKHSLKINQLEKHSSMQSNPDLSTKSFKNENNDLDKKLESYPRKQVYSTNTKIVNEDAVDNIQLEKQKLIQKSEEIKNKHKQNVNELITQSNNKVLRRAKTKEIMEYDCDFMMDAPSLFCENAYDIKPITPIETKIDKIRSILDSHKNKIIPLLQIWIGNDKSCSALFKKIMEAFIDGEDSVLEQLKKNEQLAESILSEIEISVSKIGSLYSKSSENVSNINPHV